MKKVKGHADLANKIRKEEASIPYQRKIQGLIFCANVVRTGYELREHLGVGKNDLSKLLGNWRAEGLLGSSPHPNNGTMLVHGTTNFGLIYLKERGLI